MRTSVHFIVKRIDGTAQPFSADPFSTLVEVMGAEPLANTHVFVNGRPVNKYMTLAHENITEGSVLFAAKRMSSKKMRRRARFIPTSWTDLDAAAEELEDKGERERARIADVIWSAWEMSPNHNRMLGTARSRQAAVSPDVVSDVQPSNLERAKAIQATPLPTCFANDDTGRSLAHHPDL
jgi:hypothetical protein